MCIVFVSTGQSWERPYDEQCAVNKVMCKETSDSLKLVHHRIYQDWLTAGGNVHYAKGLSAGLKCPNGEYEADTTKEAYIDGKTFGETLQMKDTEESALCKDISIMLAGDYCCEEGLCGYNKRSGSCACTKDWAKVCYNAECDIKVWSCR